MIKYVIVSCILLGCLYTYTYASVSLPKKRTSNKMYIPPLKKQALHLKELVKESFQTKNPL